MIADLAPAPAPLPAERGSAVSVIIPVRRINAYIREALPHLLKLSSALCEVVILPDEIAAADGAIADPRVRVIPTGAVGPAEKRDRGAVAARGAVLAFLDDDAYPAPEWLERACRHFADPATAAVGGPTLTPAGDSFSRQVSGWVFATRLGSGGALMRYAPRGAARPVDDWPSVNLLVRKDDFLAVGGFNCQYYPGEDTKLCLDLTRRLGKRIVYEPAAIVYHHRRPLFWGHFRQVGQYAVHRGFFAKAFPATSRRPSYFLPSGLVVGMAASGLAALVSRRGRKVAAALALPYAAALAATGASVAARSRSPQMGLATVAAVCATHVWYGIAFIRGLLARELAR